MKDIFTYPNNESSSFVDPLYSGAGTTVYSTSTVPLNKPVFIVTVGDTDYSSAKAFNGFGADGTVLTKALPAGWTAGLSKTIVWESQPSGTAEFKDSAGAFRRFSDLYAGVYRTWNAGDPVSATADIIKQAAKYFNAFDNFNGTNNLSLDDFYQYPIITHDTTRITDTAESTDTDDASGVSITLTGHAFLDNDLVELSGFDETLEALNGTSKYIDKVDADTIRLFNDYDLTSPVLFETQTTLNNQTVEILDFDATNGENVVYVYLPTVDQLFVGGTFDADDSGGTNEYIDRLSDLGTMYLKGTGLPNWYELHETSALDNRLTIDEFLGDATNYATLGVTEDFTETNPGSVAGNIKIGSQVDPGRIYKIQYKDKTGSFTNGIGGSLFASPFAHDEFHNIGGNGITTVSATQYFPRVIGGMRLTQDYEVPGAGHYIHPLFATTTQGNTIQYNFNGASPTRMAQGNMYFNIDSFQHFATEGGCAFYDPAEDDWYNVHVQLTQVQDPGFPDQTMNLMGINAGLAGDTDLTNFPLTNINQQSQDNASGTTDDYYWHWRYDEREYLGSGVMGDGGTDDTGGSRNLVNTTCKEVSFWKRQAYSGSDAVIFDAVDTIYTNDQKKNTLAYLTANSQPISVLLTPYEKRSQTVGSVDWYEIRCIATPQYSWMTNAFHLNGTAGQGMPGLSTSELSLAKQTFPVDPTNNGWHGNETNDNYVYNFTTDQFYADSTAVAYGGTTHVEPLDLTHATLAEFTADNLSGDSYHIAIGAETPCRNAGTETIHERALFDNLRTGTIVYMSTSLEEHADSDNEAGMLILKDAYTDGSVKEFWVVPVQTVNGRTYPVPASPTWYKLMSNARKTLMTTNFTSVWEQNTNYDTYWANYTTPTQLRAADEIRYFEVSQELAIGTADIVSVPVTTITDSTTGTVSLNNPSGANFFASNFEAHTFGNQKYLQLTAADTYTNNATLGDNYWLIGAAGATPWTGNYDGLPTYTFTTDSDGYLTGASLGVTTGRIKEGTRLLTVKTVADTYTPPSATTAEAEDTFDTDDEFQDTGFNNALKRWPNYLDANYKGPSSIQWRVEMPNSNTTSQSGRVFTRDSGVQKTYLDVQYPPLTEAQFRPMLRFARAVQGTFNPFYFVLHGNNNYRFMTGATADNDIDGLSNLFAANGSKILTIQGFSSNYSNAFGAGEPVILHDDKPDGDIKVVINSVDSNVFGEARIRLNTPVNSITAGQAIYKDPLHIIVTLDNDDFVYEQLADDMYRVNVSFKADVWRGE